MHFISNVKDVFTPNAVVREEDSGDLAATVLITAGFAVVAIMFVSWVSTAILNKAAETADCIEGSNVYSASASNENCKNTKSKHSDKHSFKQDEAYKGRFGNG